MPRFNPTNLTPGTKTVADVVAELLKLPQDAIFKLHIASPVDSAWTHAEISIALLTGDENVVAVSGHVFSDDPKAFFPGLSDEED